MNSVSNFIIAALLSGTSVSAQQVNIFGKVTDTAGIALGNVAVRLEKHPNINDTTLGNGLFSLTGRITASMTVSERGSMPFIRCVGSNVYFAVDRPTRFAMDAFGVSGQRFVGRFDGIIAPGSYKLPVGGAFATQVVYVRVACGGDVRIFRMQAASLPRDKRARSSSYAAPQRSRLSKTSAGAIDTLVFSRAGFITQTLPIASYAPAGSIAITMRSDTGRLAELKTRIMIAADSIRLAVQSFRQKNYKRPVFTSVFTRSQYAALVGNQTDSIPQADKDLFNGILRAEGLLRSGQDYYSTSDTAAADETAGFYVPGTDSLYVILADTATGLAFQDSLTIFHELVHALQDQYFNLTAIQDTTVTADRYYARDYTIEGEAELLMNYYGYKLVNGAYPASPAPIVSYMNEVQAEADTILDSLHKAGDPLIASMPSDWNYFSYGPKFISVVAGMNWSIIDTRIFPAPPLRMFEVLDPQKYSASNEFILNVQSLENFITGSYSMEDEDELGELLSDVMFREWDFPGYQSVSSGMTADNIIVYRTPRSDTLRMVWNTSWKDSASAAAFFENYANLVDKKRNIQLSSPVHSGTYSYVEDTHDNIYIEQSKSYVFTLENYQSSALGSLQNICRAMQPQSASLAKMEANAAAKPPRVNKHRPHGKKLHPFRAHGDGEHLFLHR